MASPGTMHYTFSMKVSFRQGFILLLVLTGHAAAAAGPPWLGKPLLEYLEWLTERDLPVIYSSNLVSAEYVLTVEPAAPATRAGLEATLEPFGLATVDGPGGRYLIVPGDDFDTAKHDLPAASALAKTVPEPLPELVVTSSHYRLSYANTTSHTFLDREVTTRLPDIGDDAVRAVARLPGAAGGGVSTRNHVRGGVENEQLFLFDGLRLYEPYHLKDFHNLSTIVDSSVVAGIDFYSAGYPVRYGDRMSGVVDIHLREPAPGRQTELALSFFNTAVLSMGRFGGDDNGDWLVSLRRGNLDLLADAVNPEYGSPRYQDAFIHLGWQWSDRTRLGLNSLLSWDKISVAQIDLSEQANARYRNRVGWLKAETDWSDSVSSTSILSATRIDNARTGLEDLPGVSSGSVTDRREFLALTFSQDWQFRWFDHWSLRAGVDVRRLEADYSYDSELVIEPPFDDIFDNVPVRSHLLSLAPRGSQYAAYLESRWRLNKRLVLETGFRWDQQTYTTAANDDQVSPRISLLYFLNDDTEIRLGFGHYYQAQEINELQIEDGIFAFHPAQRARHIVASMTRQLTKTLALRLEAYEKTYRSLMPRYENAFDALVLIPELQIDRVAIDAGNAVSRGVEVTLNNDMDSENFTWWVNYAWSDSSDSLLGGNVPRSWDQRHSLKAGVNFDWRDWSFSLAATAHSGWPKTELRVTAESPLQVTTTLRNGLKHSVYHTLDLRVSRSVDVSRGELDIFLEVNNVYNRANTCCSRYSLGDDGSGSTSLNKNSGEWLPLIPSLGLLWAF